MTDLADLPPVLTRAEAASALRVSTRGLDRMILRGDIAVSRLGRGPRECQDRPRGGPPVRILRDEILRVLGAGGRRAMQRAARQSLAERHGALAATVGGA